MAKAKAKKKTTIQTGKVSGVKISRSGGSFTFEWKQPKVWYTDWQKAWWSDSTVWKTKNRWGELKVAKGDEKRVSTWGTSAYFPNTSKKLTFVEICLQGKASNTTDTNYTPSECVYKWMDLYPPKKPTVTTEVGDYPSTTFKWSVPDSGASTQYWYTNCYMWTWLLRNSSETDGSKTNWKTNFSDAHTVYSTGGTQSGTKYERVLTGTSGEFTITEDSSLLNDGNSYTRWFCLRARGPAGESKDIYAKHVYGLPNQCEITNYQITKKTEENGYVAQVWFTSPRTAQRPLERVEVEYALTAPDAGMECPVSPGWTEGATVLPADKTSGATFSIDSLIGEDQCLFVRANAIYDDRTNYGVPVVVDVGKLASPTDLSVTPNQSNYTVAISAENESDVPDSFMVVRYMTDDDPNGFDIGIIAHGQTTATIQCPEWESTPRFGVYAVAPAGCYETILRPDGITTYEVDPAMKSDIVSDGGTIPSAPEITATPTSISGTIRVVWDWAWADADGAELSWADHADAWESTDEPDTYDVTKLNTAAWNISGLEAGKKWYIKVRLFKGTSDTRTYGAYSETTIVDLASAPLQPVLDLLPGVITEDGQVTASWVYSTTDGTQQAFAEVAEVTEENNELVYTPIAQTETAQHITIDAQEQGWSSGENHNLVCRVISASGRASDGWSNVVTVAVAEPLTCEITQSSLTSVTVYYPDDEGDPVAFTRTALTAMPMTVTVEGAGDQGLTTVSIERAADYFVDRPDETNFNGYEGETVYTITQTGEDQITINLEDLIGKLDDSASYRIIATVQDGLGQTASDEIDFEIRWSHQPDAPTATITIDTDDLTAILQPIAPQGAALTDVCDIYRLSVDKPVLVYSDATFGEKYIDPYPTIGEFGGYRFVTKTANGDYITNGENQGSFAWTDISALLDIDYNVINFGTDSVYLAFDIDLDHSWEKDFKQTKYLGGAVQGDWTKAIKRSGSISGNVVVADDDEVVQAMRRLATYPGICHVRTKDGSSFSADVQVQEKQSQSTAHKVASFTLKVTRVDPEIPDGLPYIESSEE